MKLAMLLISQHHVLILPTPQIPSWLDELFVQINQFSVIIWYFDLSSASVSSFYGIGLWFFNLNQCIPDFSISNKKSLNQFCFMLTLDNFTAICFTAALNFFNSQKIFKKCDLTRPSRMILVNLLRFKSFFNIGCPVKIWTETL